MSEERWIAPTDGLHEVPWNPPEGFNDALPRMVRIVRLSDAEMAGLFHKSPKRHAYQVLRVEDFVTEPFDRDPMTP